MIDNEDIVPELKKFFIDKNKVKLAYIFGSFVKGQMNKLSDIDIAVFFDESLNFKERFRLELELINQLSIILKTNKIDLIIMNEAPILLKYNIIKGFLIKGDISFRIKMEAKIMAEYLDEKYYIDRHTQNLIDKLAEVGSYD